MKLLTKELQKKLPPLYSQDGKGDDAIAYAKFFCILVAHGLGTLQNTIQILESSSV